MKNLEYEDGTPSRTWVEDDYDPIKLTKEQKELVRELVFMNRHRDYDNHITEECIKRVEQKLGLDDE